MTALRRVALWSTLVLTALLVAGARTTTARPLAPAPRATLAATEPAQMGATLVARTASAHAPTAVAVLTRPAAPKPPMPDAVTVVAVPARDDLPRRGAPRTAATTGPTTPAGAPTAGPLPARVLILEYHAVTDGAGQGSPYVVTQTEFARQMGELAATGAHVLTLRDVAERLASGRPFTTNTVVLTFDDGYDGVYRYALPILEQHQFAFTAFIVGSFIQDAAPKRTDGLAIMNATELRALAATGLADLESHTWNLHGNCRMLCASQGVLGADLQRNDDFLAQFGPRPVAFAYPGGDVSPDGLSVVRGQYSVACVGTLMPSGYGPADAHWLLPRFLVYPSTDIGRVAHAYFVRHWVWWTTGPAKQAADLAVHPHEITSQGSGPTTPTTPPRVSA